MGSKRRILRPGQNCWQTVKAERLAFLVDAASYFAAFAEAVAQARHSVLIAGWDLDSRIRLKRSDRDQGPRLREFLEEILRQRPELEIYLLLWDYTVLFAPDREVTARLRWNWSGHKRIHLRFDDRHPAGASHHEKIVIIDDSLAFAGGIDLARERWDTSEHLSHDSRRISPDGDFYRATHDVQLVAQGEIASKLADHLRERLSLVDGEMIPARRSSESAVWPESVSPELGDVEVGIARTVGKSRFRSEIREIETLHRDLIGSAENWVYLESQYLTSRLITELLSESLQQRNGPEIVVINPLRCEGWLERETMGTLRNENIRALQKSDRYGRFQIYSPFSAPGDEWIHVHSKVEIIDRKVARVGSANLSNRSMGLDSEVDLAVEAGDSEKVREAIARFHRRLLAEHLGVERDRVGESLDRSGSLLETIEGLRGEKDLLRPLADDSPVDDWIVSAREIYDPEKPASAKELLNRFLPEVGVPFSTEQTAPEKAASASSSGQSKFVRWMQFVSVLVLAGIVTLLWQWGPLAEWLDVRRIAELDMEQGFGLLPGVAVILIFLVGSVLMVPITLLIAGTALAFTPAPTVVYSTVGSFAASLLTFFLGRVLGSKTIHGLLGERMEEISRKLGEEGLVAVIAARIIPLGPFTMVNIVAGASHIRWKDFAVGTLVGILPGILALTLFEDRLRSLIRNPGWQEFLVVLLVLFGFAGVVVMLRRWLKKS